MMKYNFSPLEKAAMASVVLGLVKFWAYLMTGSMIVLVSFFDSMIDAVVSYVNSFISKRAKIAADKEHPFGHGGIEVLGALVQGCILIFSGFYLAFKGATLLLEPSREVYSDSFLFGAIVLFFSAIGGLAIERYLRRWERHLKTLGERSLSLLADKSHYLGDFAANLLAALGLIFVWLTGWKILDVLIGIIGALILVWIAYPILKNCLQDILHARADPEFQRKIEEIVKKTDHRIQGLHMLRTRQYGPTPFVNFHLKLFAETPLREAHEIEEMVKAALRQNYPRIDVEIHLDPDSEPDEDHWESAT